VAEDDHTYRDDDAYPGGQVEIPLIGSVHSPRDRNRNRRCKMRAQTGSSARVDQARLGLTMPDIKRLHPVVGPGDGAIRAAPVARLGIGVADRAGHSGCNTSSSRPAVASLCHGGNDGFCGG
jgi:hypothetical protein